MGAGALEGNMAYGSVDLALSAYSLSKLILKPDAWRLFRMYAAIMFEDMRNQAKRH
ncbi:DUF4225 domain-containing protein [Pseudomonas guariconensis]|uniref:DUF4225 domain-containing protein n=1 Tax=Pseudomonas guariconensis TaxID=1288410 RepID=UPI003466B121